MTVFSLIVFLIWDGRRLGFLDDASEIIWRFIIFTIVACPSLLAIAIAIAMTTTSKSLEGGRRSPESPRSHSRVFWLSCI